MADPGLMEAINDRFPIASDDAEPPEVEPPVRLSSAFPYAGKVDFLPRPLLHLDGEGGDAKTGKKVDYVSWGLMGTMLESFEPPQVIRDDLIHNRRFWVNPTELRQLESESSGEPMEAFRVWYSGEAAIRPRVTVGRAGSASNLFYQGEVRFHDGCGLYILAEYHSDEGDRFRKAVENGLRVLGEQGLGGRRSVGLGRFELEIEENVALAGPGGDDDPHLLLSLYHPTWREVEAGRLEGARYKLILRGGWLLSPDSAGLRRKGLRMLAEGAIVSGKPTGDIRDVKPTPQDEWEVPHPVYRSGLALSVPCGRWKDG